MLDGKTIMISNILIIAGKVGKDSFYLILTISASVYLFTAIFSPAPMGNKINAPLGSNNSAVNGMKEFSLNYHKHTYNYYKSTGKKSAENQKEVIPEFTKRLGDKKEIRKKAGTNLEDVNLNGVLVKALKEVKYQQNAERKWREDWKEEINSTTISTVTRNKFTNEKNDLTIDDGTTTKEITISVDKVYKENHRSTEKMLDTTIDEIAKETDSENHNENEGTTEENKVEKENEDDEEKSGHGKKNKKDDCDSYHIHLPRDYVKSIKRLTKNIRHRSSKIDILGYTLQVGDKKLNLGEIIPDIPFYASLISSKRNDISLSHRVRRKFEIKIRLILISNNDSKKTYGPDTSVIDKSIDAKKYDHILLQLKNEVLAFNDPRSTTIIISNNEKHNQTEDGRNSWRLARKWIRKSMRSGKLYELDKEWKSPMTRVYDSLASYPLIGIDIPNKRVATRKVKQITVNKMRGSTTKLILELKGNQKVLFKHKRLLMTDLIKDKFWPAFHGRERFQCEIMAFHLSRVLDFRKTPITVGRRSPQW
ncbi:uncharacterized protein LOC135927023 [Gordionus sp. m RMFG-2023]|uniref:uncharacterized protein LOC135927023 n=1 Tax=Gordionus sp. m RMFG-2023 TaxID=3053472 RepID=UPI0031FBF0B2